jgi:succinate dehydrogenase / fumarate reductase cytochrome b subunit
MIWTGALIAFFVMYHLLHLTTGTLHPSFDEQDVYHNVIAGFSQLTVSTGYIVAMIVLGLHLLHGTWSMFQSLGLTYPKYNAWRRLFATGMTIILALGNITMPLIILAKHW